VKSGAAFFRRPRSLCVSVVGYMLWGTHRIVIYRAVDCVLWSLLEDLDPPAAGKVIDDDFAFWRGWLGMHYRDERICRAPFLWGRSKLAELRLLATRSVRE
jgi:hypothetical protein